MPYFIFLNDRIVEEAEGRLSTLDRGFLYGDGLFETFRTYTKKPFRLEDRITRLSNSAKTLDIPFRFTIQQIKEIIDQLIVRNNLEDAYVRMTLSRGFGSNDFIQTGNCAPTFAIHTKPLVVYPASLYKTGVPLITSSIRKSVTCPLSSHKTLNFLTNYLIKKDAVKKGFHDALVLNTNSHVAECAVSNIFIVEKNSVITPSLKTNILPGITRKIILELCKENNIHAAEELFSIKRVLRADEVFITNSLMEVMPVSKIDTQSIGRLIPGAITKLLHDKYKALTHKTE